MKVLKKVFSWILMLTLVCSAFLPSKTAAEANPSTAKTYYVALNGDDSNDGTINNPLKTVEAARNKIREEGSEGGVTVYVRGGDYTRSSSFELTEADSGTAENPIIYAAYPGETVTFTGQVTLDNSKFQAVTDPAILARLPQEAQDKIKVYDLKAEGIPSGQLPKKIAFQGTEPAAPILYVNGVKQTVASYPNQTEGQASTYIQATSIVDKGWQDLSPWDPDLPNRPGPVLSYAGSSDEARIDKWAQEDEVFIIGSIAWEWEVNTLQVVVDAAKKTITGQYPVSITDRVLSGGGFYGYNLLCELDVAGEYYIDRTLVDGVKTDKLYLHVGDGLGDETVKLDVLGAPFVSMTNVSNVSFQGIDFHGNLDTGISMKNCENCGVYDSDISGCSLYGVYIEEGHDNIVSGCCIHDLTSDGVYMSGGNFETLEPSSHIVENCEIYNCNSGLVVYGVGQVVRRNYIHDLPFQAVGYLGNDFLFEFNYIKNVCYNTSDAGVFYSGRNWTTRGTVIRYNYMRDISRGTGVTFGIYCDDALSSIEAYGNIFDNFGMQGIALGGGRENIFHDNIYIDVPGWKINSDARTLSYDWFNTTDSVRGYKERPITNEYWSAKYPELAATYGHLVLDANDPTIADKTVKESLDPDLFNPMFPAGNKVYDEIVVGSNEWNVTYLINYNDIDMIHEFGDFEDPVTYWESEEALASYRDSLVNGVRTATPEQMEAWKAAYVAQLTPVNN